MKFIDKSTVPVPEILTTKGVAETEKNKALYLENIAKYTSSTKGTRTTNEETVAANFVFKKSRDLYGHPSVKSVLITLQNKCCCFCESRITHISSGDIEHFRPKAGYSQDKTDLFHKPGYFWLVYDWDNLLFSCELCNRRFKKSLFPLTDRLKRCKMDDTFDTAIEESLFINPYEKDPAKHITFIKEIPQGTTIYGAATITSLGLDREDLNEMRRDSLSPISILKKVYERDKGTGNEESSKNLFKKALNEKINITGQYSLMFKNNFTEYL